MKWFYIPILLLIVFIQSISNAVTLAGFKLNQDFIASVLCINKMKPLSDCKGKCQLAKMMSENNEDVPAHNSIRPNSNLQLFTVSSFVWNIPPASEASSPMAAHQPIWFYPSPVESIFHPPA